MIPDISNNCNAFISREAKGTTILRSARNHAHDNTTSHTIQENVNIQQQSNFQVASLTNKSWPKSSLLTAGRCTIITLTLSEIHVTTQAAKFHLHHYFYLQNYTV
jgi:hypothetical protein